NVGKVLQFGISQPWTMITYVDLYTVAMQGFSTKAIMLMGNCGGPPFTGYEFWIDGGTGSGATTGVLRSRFISDYGTGNYLGVYGSVVVPTDGQYHQLVETYDGSGTTAGIKFYIDGVLDPHISVEANHLTGSIVTSNPMLIGEQTG